MSLSPLRGRRRAGGARPRGARDRRRPGRHARRTRARRRPYDDAGYWAFADRMQQRLDRLWDERDGYYHGGGGGADPMTNSMLLLTHSVAALSGHEGPARNDAPRPPARRAARHRRAVRDVTDRHRPDARAGLRELDDPTRAAASTSSSTPRSSTASSTPTRRARRCELPGLDRRQAPQRDLTHRARLVLALPDDPAQPGQLVRADVRRRRHRHRRPDAAQARPARCSCCASCAARGAELRARHALPLPAARAAQPPDERGLGRVREHRPELHALLRPGAARRHGAAAGRAQAADRRSGSSARWPATGRTAAT